MPQTTIRVCISKQELLEYLRAKMTDGGYEFTVPEDNQCEVSPDFWGLEHSIDCYDVLIAPTIPFPHETTHPEPIPSMDGVIIEWTTVGPNLPFLPVGGVQS